MSRGMIRKPSESSVKNVSVRASLIKSNDMTKYVELVVEDLRTRVRFPPTPPFKANPSEFWRGFVYWTTNRHKEVVSFDLAA